jgi:short-subunit dehydrogenase
MGAPRQGHGRTALVTGASSGIGAALARVFARNGFDLVLTARREGRLVALKERLEEEYDVQVRSLPLDLARPDAPAWLTSELARAGVAVDVLVNNAGFSLSGLYRDTAWEAQRDCLQVLVTAPLELTHRLLPFMQMRNYGRILNVASVAGMLPGAASGTLYGASKAMLIAFSEALHAEQKGTNVHVTALCPGFTYTEFHDANGTRGRLRRVPKFLWLSAEKVADEGYSAVMKNEVMRIPGGIYRALSGAARLVPRGAAYRLAARAGAFRRGGH